MTGEGNGPLERVTREGGPVRVPAFVLRVLEAVRESGATNMLDRPRVIEIACAFGCGDAAVWIEAHRSEYASGIFRGFEADTDADAAK
jgi:hypothetical protein